VIGREGPFQSVHGELTSCEQGPRIIDEHIDARFGCGDLCGQPFHFGNDRQIADVQRMGLTAINGR
jgi:hypothetical protein